MGRLRDRVAETIRDQRLWSPDDRVAVAVSGGLDSVVLLDVLLATAGLHRGRLSVVTVDHGTRAESAGDADFVEALAQGRGLPCHRADLSLGHGASEAELRSARFAVFACLDVDRVALAHHRDDQAETVLLSLLRGSGSRGLAGMAFRRDRYVRPLLAVPRQDLVDHARAHGLAWREDASNADPRYLRNRVRAELIPLLEDLRPGAAAALSRSATWAAEDDALLTTLAAEQLGLDDGTLSTLALRVAPRALARRAVASLDRALTAAQIDAILAAADRGSGTVHLSGGSVVRIDGLSVSIHHDA